MFSETFRLRHLIAGSLLASGGMYAIILMFTLIVDPLIN
jgi:hypothetical protein